MFVMLIFESFFFNLNHLPAEKNSINEHPYKRLALLILSGLRMLVKVEICLEQREVEFLPPTNICENLNFSTEIQIFANFAG